MTDGRSIAVARWLPWLGLLAGLALLALRLPGELARPLHADEAGQWSLLAEGRPHSATGDRFHGPLLGQLASAGLGLAGLAPEAASETALRLVPLVFALSLLSLPWLAPRAWGWRGAFLPAFLATVAVLPAARFIQEPILATCLVLGAMLWLRSGEISAPGWLSPVAGLLAGLALACKVSAGLYLAAAGLAFGLMGARPGVRRLGAFGVGAALAWLLSQSSFLTDLPALVTWFRQLGRAFGLATGLGEPALPMESPLAWILSSATLAVLALLRWRARSRLGPWGSGDIDPLLAASAGILALHLVLPYKTPWLLLTLDLLALAVLAPRLVLALGEDRLGRVAGIALVALVLSGRPLWSVHRHDYVETGETLPRLAQALARMSPPVRIEVAQGHPWPLPYYLRGLTVAYGSRPLGAPAEVRLTEGAAGDVPRLAGYRTLPFAMRPNELWWLFVREERAAELDARLAEDARR